jgi:H(+)-translocating pyrophosphatase
MLVAVDANARTTVAAASEPPSRLTAAFNVAFRAGAVMGFALCALGLGVLLALLLAYRVHFSDVSEWATMMDCVAGFGLGGSSVAMFGRVGGGIYTKAADVGADLVGKVVHGLEEDDPKNPATIADNVGDNVGDVAGMGSDLFGSLAESTCAALVIASTSSDLLDAGWAALLFPLTISAAGILVCMACSFIATHLKPVVREADVESALKLQLISTTFLVVPVVVYLAHSLLPDKFELPSVVSGTIKASSTGAAICVSVGALGGLLIGLVTEYYTSHSYEPVRECAHVCKQGAAVNLIYGLALGYRSAIVPVYTLAAIVYFAFSLADLYGVALAALGMLSTLATGLTIDGYGPVTDNAGGIAEMAQLPAACREKTDCLDACGCGVPLFFACSLRRCVDTPRRPRVACSMALTPRRRRDTTYRYARRPGLDAVDASARHLDAVAAAPRRRDMTYTLHAVAAAPHLIIINAGPATRPRPLGRASPLAPPPWSR